MIGRAHFSTAERDTVPASASELRAAAEQARHDAAAQAAALMASAEQAAAELVAQAETLESEAAEQARQDAYLTAVDQGRASLDSAVRQWEAVEAQRVRNEAHRDEMAQRHRDATANAERARAELSHAVDTDGDVHELERLRLALATSESVPGLVGQQLERAENAHQRTTESVSQALEAVGDAWHTLERLKATEGLERPSCLPPPRDRFAEALAALARQDVLMEAASHDPRFNCARPSVPPVET